MNLDRIAKRLVADLAPQVVIERHLDGSMSGPAVESEAVQESWDTVLKTLGLASTDWIGAEEFYRAYLAFGAKLTGLGKLLADMVADMAQEAMENGYPEFRPNGISFVAHRSACRFCPPERRFAGLSIMARLGQ